MTSFRIADIVFAITSDRQTGDIRIEDAYRDFLCGGKPDITIHADYDGIPLNIPGEGGKVFDSGSIWSLYHRGEENFFVLRSPIMGPHPYRIGVFDAGFRQGRVYFNHPAPGEQSDGLLPNPLEFPLSELLMICLLAQGKGLLVHACGVEDNGRGYLFAGNSTHGKSTIARIFKDRALILNDDRIVLRWRDNRFWMYGTPWHGDYSGTSPNGVPLEKILFLRHAAANTAELKEGASASTMLLARCFPTLWDADGMRFTLDFCAQLVTTIPCFELGFAPDINVVDFVRCVK